MNNEELKAKVISIIPKAELKEGGQFLEATVAPNKIAELAKGLKESPDTAFDFLMCLTGMDYGDSLGVIYHLESTTLRHKIVLKTKASSRENPVIESITSVFHAAECLEREVYDLFGVSFRNHPDLRRLFLEETWVGHPLRKDYVDEINIIER
jgi:NADH:ubiquinone oxidoreductase subunit C